MKIELSIDLEKAIGVVLILFLITMAPLHLTNSYLRSNDFDTVKITGTQTIESIAGRYTVDSADRDNLTEAIAEVNGIDSKAELRAGQSIKVPVLNRNNPASLTANK